MKRSVTVVTLRWSHGSCSSEHKCTHLFDISFGNSNKKLFIRVNDYWRMSLRIVDGLGIEAAYLRAGLTKRCRRRSNKRSSSDDRWPRRADLSVTILLNRLVDMVLFVLRKLSQHLRLSLRAHWNRTTRGE